MKKKFVCKNCGKEYESDKPNSKFCSRECRKQYNNVEYECDYCGKKITIYRNRYEKLLSGKLKHIYCSKECTTKAQTKKVTKICEYCGKEYQIGNCFKDIQRFCSKECHDAYRKEHAFRYQSRVCPTCGKEYLPKHRNQIYCCRECAHESYRSDDSELVHYLRANNRYWRKDALESRGNKCELTGSTDNLIVHHIRSFSLIFKETLEVLDFEYLYFTYEYTNEQLELLRNTFRMIQNKYGYAVIHENIHKLFHKEYGYGDNTEKQWKEFIEKHKDEFDDLV